MNIIKKLDLWQKEGLIESSQKEAIIKFEDSNKKPKLFYTILAIAFFSIGVGILSIIASNWGAIPGFVKIFFDVVLLSVVAYYIFDANSKGKSLLLEGLLVLYPILIIASIGLVAQVFHIPPSGYSGLLFWSVMVAPLLFLSKKMTLSFVWFAVAYYSILSFTFDVFPKFLAYFRMIFEAGGGFAVFALILLIPAIFAFSYQFFIKEKESNFVKSCLSWVSFGLFVFGVSFDVFSNFFTKEYYYFMSYLGDNNLSKNIDVFYGILILANMGLIYFSRKMNIKYIFYIILSLLISSYLLINFNYEIMGLVSTMTMIFILMRYAYSQNSLKLFNFGAFLVIARLFLVYIQLFGGLLATGLGLIISGIVLILLLHIWRKYSAIFFKVLKEAKKNEAK